MNSKIIEKQLETEYHVSWYIIAYKMIFGLIEFLLGVGIAIFGRNMFTIYTHYLTQELLEEPHDLLARLSRQIVPGILTHNTYLILYLVLLGAAKIAGAVGLLYKKHWGVDLLVGLTLIMFPFQIIQLIRSPSIIDFTYIIVGLLIALYLINFQPKAWASRVARHHGRKLFS
jgi:uncharacterized membrane protein